MVSINNLEIICTLLHCQPGDVIGMLWCKNDAFLPNEPIKPKVYILDRDLIETLK